MTRRCPPGEVLTAYVENRDGDTELADHVRTCSDCSAVTSILLKLSDLDVLDEVGRYLADVETLVSEVLSIPAHRRWVLLREERFHRADLARRLLARGLEERWRDPQVAIDLTRDATTIADAFRTEELDLLDLRFQTWNAHSALLRESGRYRDCRTALAHAESAAERACDVELARASVLLARALLASEPDVWDPEAAAAMLDAVEPVYLRRDMERWLRARTARGTLLYRMGDPACVGVYREVLAGTPERHHAAYTDALANVIVARVDTGDGSADVDELLARVEAHDRSRNERALLARDAWLHGKLFALQRRHETALEAYRTAIAKYREYDNYDAAVRVGIDTVASLVALEEYAPAIELCRELARWSTRLEFDEPSRRRMLTAEVARYLRELAERFALTEDVTADVRSYIRKINNQKPIPFIPPVSLHTE